RPCRGADGDHELRGSAQPCLGTAQPGQRDHASHRDAAGRRARHPDQRLRRGARHRGRRARAARRFLRRARCGASARGAGRGASSRHHRRPGLQPSLDAAASALHRAARSSRAERAPRGRTACCPTRGGCAAARDRALRRSGVRRRRVSTAPLAAERRPAQAALLLLAMTSLFWGLNWPVMKLSLTGIPVLPFRAICLLVAGPTMLAIARLRGDSLRLSRGEALRLTLAAFFNVTLWHLSTAYGVSKMPAGASLFGALFLGEKLTWSRVAALVLGMGGVAALLLPELHAIRAAPLGA